MCAIKTVLIVAVLPLVAAGFYTCQVNSETKHSGTTKRNQK